MVDPITDSSSNTYFIDNYVQVPPISEHPEDLPPQFKTWYAEVCRYGIDYYFVAELWLFQDGLEGTS